MKLNNYNIIAIIFHKHTLLLSLITWTLSTTKAQEQFQLTNFIYSIHGINPAFSGIEDAPGSTKTALFRKLPRIYRKQHAKKCK